MIGRTSGLPIHKAADELKSRNSSLANRGINLNLVNLCQAQRPKKQMKNHPLIVEGIL